MKDKLKSDIVAAIQQGSQEVLSLDSLTRPLMFSEINGLVDFHIKRVLADTTKTANGDIVFTSDQELTRDVAGHLLHYSFIRKSKRLNLFRSLVDSQDYCRTATLQRLLECPTPESLRKLVGSLNRDLALKLQVRDRFIESRRGFGYRLNKNISIVFG